MARCSLRCGWRDCFWTACRGSRSHAGDDRLSRDGFLHPYRIEGGVGEVTVKILLRDFETARLADRAEVLHQAARLLKAEYPLANVDVKVIAQYRNMREGLVKEPLAPGGLAEQA